MRRARAALVILLDLVGVATLAVAAGMVAVPAGIAIVGAGALVAAYTLEQGGRR